jgi:hypothetical protein
MFSWFRPVCPCDPAAKRWVEDRLRWLTRQFGLHVLLERPIILPTEEFFPDPWDGSTKAACAMFHRVCEYMGVDRTCVELRFFDQKERSWSPLGRAFGIKAGTWSGAEQPWLRGVVSIERGGLYQPADLVGIMAHELSHQRLLGEGRADPDAFDNELLTDLTAVFFGFGVFLANNPRKSTGKLDRWPGTSLFRPEYLSEPMLGYALAHIAWHRDEGRPAWAKALRWAPRAVFKQGHRFLTQRADSSFKPVRLRRTTSSDD